MEVVTTEFASRVRKRREFWQRSCHRDIVHRKPFDTLGNHRWRLGVALRDILRTISIIESAPPYQTFGERSAINVIGRVIDDSIPTLKA